MKRRRRTPGLFLVVLVAAVAAGWILWMPYDEAALFRAIPAGADLVTAHDNLMARLPELATNRWIAGLIDPESDVILGDRELWRQAAPRLALAARLGIGRRLTVCARLSAPPGTSDDSWVLATWIGRWSPVLRWTLFWLPWQDLDELGAFAGRTLWSLKPPLSGSQRLSFACGEGALIACLSSDPAGIREAMMAYDGLIPSTGARPELQAAPLPDAPDHFWIRWPGLGAEPLLSTAGAVSRLTDRQLAAALRLPAGLLPPGKLRPAPGEADPLLLKARPSFILTAPLPYFRDRLPPPGVGPEWVQMLGRIAQADWVRQDDNRVTLVLATGPYGGGFGRAPLRLRLPALLASLSVSQPEAVYPAVSGELDRLNARHRWGVIQDPAPIRAGAHAVWTIEPTGSALLSNLGPADRPAYAVADGRLIAASQAGSLAAALARPAEAADTAPWAPWRETLTASNVAAMAWLDLQAGGNALQLVLSAWALFGRGPNAPPIPAAVTRAGALLDRLRPLQSGAVWLESENGNPLLRLQIGPPDAR